MASLLANPVIRHAVVPLSVEQYRRIGEAGIIDERTELIRGVILHKMNKSPLHTLTVKKLVDALRPLLSPGFELRKEEPLTLQDSEPEPDIAVVEVDSGVVPRGQGLAVRPWSATSSVLRSSRPSRPHSPG